jgi:SAM-dependent methyltransferase
VNNREAWEAEAENWVQFARTPDHDDYWFYRNSFFEGIVPPPGQVTLEVGSGEGRVTRDLVHRGHRVASVDGSMTLLRNATHLDPVSRYVLSDATRLPVQTGSVDLVVAYNSLMDFDDMPAAIAEVARVLSADGSFCICITHPMHNSGGFDGKDVEAPFVLRNAYFGTRQFEDKVVRNEITMHFRGWARPIQDYFGALFGAGFVVDALQEPVPIVATGRYERWHRFPMFLHLRAIKRRW